MPRYLVVAFDPNDNTSGYYTAKHAGAPDAICNHPWIQQIYKDEWVAKNLFDSNTRVCLENIAKSLGWAIVCVNLDEEIMKDLNGGDSNVSSQTQQN